MHIHVRTPNGHLTLPRITDTLVRKLSTPTSGNRITKDARVRGFGIRVTAGGARSFVLGYTVHGRERRMTIGEFPAWTTLAALEEAKRLRRLVDQNIDPLEQRIAAREAPTVRDLAKRFLDEHAPKRRPSYLINNSLIVDRWILPALGNVKVADVRPSHIEILHRKVTKAGSPVMANRVIACLSKILSLAVRWEMRTDNPAKGAVDRNNELQRKRYLEPPEFARLTEALRRHPSQLAADAVRLIMLTGCRRGEALSARWDQFDSGKKVWSKPAASTKQEKDHEIPLSAPARELLTRMERSARGPFLFPSRDGKGHMTDLKTSWRTLCEMAGLEGVRLHDLRHSFAAIAVSRGATLPLIGALLGHSNPNTTNRYAHLYDDPQRAVAESVASVITGTGEDGEVVPFDRASGRR
jgi:integrase